MLLADGITCYACTTVVLGDNCTKPEPDMPDVGRCEGDYCSMVHKSTPNDSVAGKSHVHARTHARAQTRTRARTRTHMQEIMQLGQMRCF